MPSQAAPDGAFDDVTVKAGLTGKDLDFNFGVAVGDYDNDGYEDLFLCSAGRNALYHNNGNGTFTDVTAIAGIGGKPANTLSVVAAWFDYDNDGLLDLIVDNYTVWTPQTDIRCAMGEVEHYCDPRPLSKRAATALSQFGTRKVCGRHRQVGLRRSAWQRHGHLHRGFQ
ncbi:MAG: VCBS repeat-containing protein [Ignavibacteriota bacterium]